MTEEEYERFRHQSVHQLMALNDTCEQNFSISHWARWDYDLEEGKLVFSEEGQPRVVANVLVAGTTSDASNTWMWGWANGNLPAGVARPMDAVREYGVAESIDELKTELLSSDEYLGWALTAVAARLLGAKGAYRCPSDNGFVYLIYTEIQRLQPGESLPAKSERTRIECDTHGTASAAYICEHLAASPAQEWFSGDITEENPWPDAWCEKCDFIYQEQGEWNDTNSNLVSINLLAITATRAAAPKPLSRVQHSFRAVTGAGAADGCAGDDVDGDFAVAVTLRSLTVAARKVWGAAPVIS